MAKAKKKYTHTEVKLGHLDELSYKQRAYFLEEIIRRVPAPKRREWGTGTFTREGDVITMTLPHKSGDTIVIKRAIPVTSHTGLGFAKELGRDTASRMLAYHQKSDPSNWEWTDKTTLDDCELAAVAVAKPEPPSKTRMVCEICGPEDDKFPAWGPCIHMEKGNE